MYTFSKEHKDFLKKLKHEKLIVNFFRILIISIFLVLWELLAKFSIINTFMYSSPSRILHTICTLFQSGSLLHHINITVFEVCISFLFATVIGTVTASILWANERISKIVDPYITIINSLPKVALGPLIIIWVGASIRSIIFMALTISVFTTIINIYNGFQNVNSNYIIMLKSFHASKFQIYRKVILPSNIENIIATLKINISLSLIGVIMGELLVSKKGLGYLIMYGSQVFNLDLVISSIVILAILSYVMYLIVDRFEKYIIKRRS